MGRTRSGERRTLTSFTLPPVFRYICKRKMEGLSLSELVRYMFEATSDVARRFDQLHAGDKERGGWFDVISVTKKFVENYPICTFSDERTREVVLFSSEELKEIDGLGSPRSRILKRALNLVRLYQNIDLIEKAHDYYDPPDDGDKPTYTHQFRIGLINGFFDPKSNDRFNEVERGRRATSEFGSEKNRKKLVALIRKDRKEAFKAIRECYRNRDFEALGEFINYLDHPLDI